MKKRSSKYKVVSMKYCMVVVLLFALGCNTKSNWQETPSGLQYQIHENKEGAKAHFGDGLQLHLIYKNANDSVLFDSKVLGNAFIIELSEPLFSGSVEEGFTMMGEGDSASFLVVADSVYKKVFSQAMPASIELGSRLRIDVRLNKILTPSQYKAFKQGQEKSPELLEDEQIQQYMANNQLSGVPDTNGLYFISFVEGTGKLPKPGDQLEVSYLVRSLKSEVYDESEKGFQFRLGDTTMVAGWNQALARMKVGGKARFIVPSKLGYGEKGDGRIPPHTILVFDVDLIRIN